MIAPIGRGDLDHVLEHARGWEDLRGERLFLTGATGFYGRWLLESLLHANDQLGLRARAVVLTRNVETFAVQAPHLAASPDLQLHRGDVRSFAAPPGSFAFVVHAATPASARMNAEEPRAMLDTIVQGANRVAAFSEEAGVRRLLFASSGAVYGPQPSSFTHVPETHLGGPDPMDPHSAYAEGKRVAELTLTLAGAARGFVTVSARGFAFVGPHLPLDGLFAIGNFIRDGLRGGPIRVTGDGSPYRSYLYAADLAAWLWTMLLRGRAGRAYNVGSEDGHPLREVAERVATQFATRVVVDGAATAPSPASRYVPSTRRAREELGLAARVDLDEGIRRTIEWHLRPPERGPQP